MLGYDMGMKLIVEVTTRDERIHSHECVDFPHITSQFITLYKEGFVREVVATETIAGIKQYFKP